MGQNETKSINNLDLSNQLIFNSKTLVAIPVAEQQSNSLYPKIEMKLPVAEIIKSDENKLYNLHWKNLTDQDKKYIIEQFETALKERNTKVIELIVKDFFEIVNHKLYDNLTVVLKLNELKMDQAIDIILQKETFDEEPLANKMTALECAAKNNDINLIIKFIKYNKILLPHDSLENLFVVKHLCFNGHEDQALIYIKMIAKVNFESLLNVENNQSVLSIAMQKNLNKIINYFCTELQIRKISNIEPFIRTIFTEIVQYEQILDFLPKEFVLCSYTNKNLLMFALEKNDNAICDLILKKVNDIMIIMPFSELPTLNKFLENSLIKACLLKNFYVIEKLIVNYCFTSSFLIECYEKYCNRDCKAVFLKNINLDSKVFIMDKYNKEITVNSAAT